MTWHRPKHISQRENAHVWPTGEFDGPAWEDCGPVSVCLIADATTDGAQPTRKTLAEAEALRKAAGYGPNGGTNIQRLSAAAVIRYRIPLPRHVTGPTAIRAALKTGFGAAVAGTMGNFPRGHRLRRWQPSFTGGHAVYIARESTTARWLWLDPLAPQGTYSGDWITADELATFLRGPIAAACVVPLVKEA